MIKAVIAFFRLPLTISAFCLVVCFFYSPQTFAYPELIRHGLPNCNLCHVSPAGGGAVKPFGRQVSEESLSTWKREGEGKFAYGVVPLPEWLHVGGDIRAVSMLRDTPQARATRVLPMQADLEIAAASAQGFGMFGAVSGGVYFSLPQSRKHYVGYQFENGPAIRLGRFEQAFGVMGPYHIEPTRRGLGWEEGYSTYNMEVSWIKDGGSIFLTANAGRPDKSSLDREKGFAARGAFYLGSSAELGLSYFNGKNNTGSRTVLGPYANIALSPKWVLISEWDYQHVSPVGGDSPGGWVTLNKVDYEMTQGFHLIFQGELSRPNAKSYRSTWNAYGAGIQFFPRPHVELSGQWMRRTTPEYPDERSELATFMLHYYL